MMYVAMDIGCIECGEESHCIGIFRIKEVAERLLEEHRQRQNADWHGQHYFEMFEVVEIDLPQSVESYSR